MNVHLENAENRLTVHLDGEIDHHSIRPVREEIDETATRLRPAELILDFKDVSFMDSSGIGLIMGRYRLMEQLGGKITLTNLSPGIKKVVKLSGLDRLVHIL